jgi:hypothetical protein
MVPLTTKTKIMRKLSTKGFIITVIFTTLSVVLFYACRKTEQRERQKAKSSNPTKFFGVKPGTDTVVAAIAEDVKRQDEKRHFVDKLIIRAGYPVWDKAKISEKDGEGKQIFIPFVLEKTKQTRAMLIAKINNGDTAYRLLYNSRARHFGFDKKSNEMWNAKDVFHAFVLFDYELFGHTKFTVSNGKYLDDTASAVKEFKIQLGDNPNQSAYRGQGLYPVTTWVTFITCGLCGFKETATGTNSLDRCCNATYNIVPVIYWFNDETDETTYDLPTGYVEDGGGMLCPGCSWDDTNPCDIEPPYTQVCDGEWTPTLHVPAYNPFHYDDTIRITNGLETVFPCIADFIRDSLSNPNLLAQIAGADVWHDSAEIKLTFDTSTVFTSETSANTAVTSYVSDHVFVNDQGITEYSATISLNPWFLRHGTKEFNISNILHEIMHATFTLRWGQYQDWLIDHNTQYDSNFIKAKFPLYWYAIQNQQVNLTSLQDHEIMATDYVGQFSYIMRQFYNPNASTAIRDTVIKALAYHGLLETTVWKDLPRIGIDTCKYKNIMVSAEKASINQAATGCGGSTIYRYSQDLKLRPHCQ